MQRAFELATALPEDRQDAIGEMLLLAIDQENSPLRLSSEQQDEVRRRLSARGEVATSAEADLVFAKLAERLLPGAVRRWKIFKISMTT